jgi:glycerol uptake facilitator-like aquaporin
MYKQFVAEFIGTFILILAILATGEAIPIGIALALAVFLFGGVSGAHLNPAVTITKMTSKSMDINTGASYIVAQVLGGICAYLVHKRILSK